MKYIRGIEAYRELHDTAVTLGKFDGLHRGHQKLVKQIQEYQKWDHVSTVLFSFDMEPFYDQLQIPHECIMTNEERRMHLEGMVDYLIECPFVDGIRNMQAEAFIRDVLVKRFRMKHAAVGTDFRFGHEKRGDHVMLEHYAAQYGYTVDVVEKEKYNGRIISSTYIKEELKEGRIETVNQLLGYPYMIAGEVEHGKRLGRKLGFPTVNITPDTKKLLPVNGVYINEILIDGKWYQGVGNIGVKPTVEENGRKSVESYILDYSGNAYGKQIQVRFLEYVRPELHFEDINALKAQMAKDIEKTRAHFKRQ